MTTIISPDFYVPHAQNNNPQPPFPFSHARIGIDSVIKRGQITASSTEAGFFVDNLASPWTSERWRAETMPATVNFSFDAAEIDYIGIAAHNMGDLGTNIKVEVTTDGIAYTELYVAQVGENVPIMLLLESSFVSGLRITLTGDDAPEIGVVYAGKALAMQRCITGGFKPYYMAYDTTIYGGLSEAGQFTARTIRRKGIDVSASFNNLSPQWVRSNIRPLIKKMRYRPFFFLWRPDLYPFEAAYVFCDKTDAPSYSSYQFMTWQFSGRGWTDD